MSGPEKMHISFRQLGTDYQISLVRGGKSDHSVEINGVTYAVLGDKEKLKVACEILNSVPLNDISNSEDLKGRLSTRSDLSFPSQKADEIGVKALQTKSISKSKIIEEKNLLEIDIPTTIKEIGENLEQYYIFPDIARKCSEHLQLQLKKGAYENISDLKTFADAVTRDLYEISEDKHMVFDVLEAPPVITPTKNSLVTDKEESNTTEKVIPAPEERYPIPDLEEKSYEYKSKYFPYELKSGKLKDETNFGYLDLRTFGICKTGDDDDLEERKESVVRRNAFIESVNHLKGAKSIIIDLRNNGGGTPNGVQLLCSLFMEEGSHLDSILRRRGNSYTMEAWDTLPHKELPKEMRLLEQKVIVLISPTTFSAAESFANSMRVLGRATIIGERSKGGANPRGDYKPIGKYFDIGIPDGRAINPNREDEGNWEGVGIIPDHEVSAKDALNTAISLSKG